MRQRSTLNVWLVVLTAVCLVPHAFGQATLSFAQLNGTVLDTSGRIVVGASVSARNLGTNQSYAATTNSSGYYVVPNLPPGQYELTVQATGFGKSVETGFTLTVGQTATLDVTLKVAGVGESVTVTTEAPPVETSRTEISQVIDAPQIQSLPVNGRQFVDFALLTPGVATGRTSIQSTFTEPDITRISFGGMRDLSNAVTVDGADYIDEGTGSQRATPSQEAVSEFRVVNNSFGAEYGRAEERRRIEKEKLVITTRHRVLATILQRASAPLKKADLLAVAHHLIGHLSYSQVPALAKRHKVEAKEDSASAQELLAKQVGTYDESELCKLLLEIGLLDSAYQRSTASSDDVLMDAAKRYRVDAEKLQKVVAEELAAKRDKRTKAKAKPKNRKTAA